MHGLLDGFIPHFSFRSEPDHGVLSLASKIAVSGDNIIVLSRYEDACCVDLFPINIASSTQRLFSCWCIDYRLYYMVHSLGPSCCVVDAERQGLKLSITRMPIQFLNADLELGTCTTPSTSCSPPAVFPIKSDNKLSRVRWKPTVHVPAQQPSILRQTQLVPLNPFEFQTGFLHPSHMRSPQVHPPSFLLRRSLLGCPARM